MARRGIMRCAGCKRCDPRAAPLPPLAPCVAECLHSRQLGARRHHQVLLQGWRWRVRPALAAAARACAGRRCPGDRIDRHAPEPAPGALRPTCMQLLR